MSGVLDAQLQGLATVFRFLERAGHGEDRLSRTLSAYHLYETWQFAKLNPDAVRETTGAAP